jgi:hypothetical protein
VVQPLPLAAQRQQHKPIFTRTYRTHSNVCLAVEPTCFDIDDSPPNIQSVSLAPAVIRREIRWSHSVRLLQQPWLPPALSQKLICSLAQASTSPPTERTFCRKVQCKPAHRCRGTQLLRQTPRHGQHRCGRRNEQWVGVSVGECLNRRAGKKNQCTKGSEDENQDSEMS